MNYIKRERGRERRFKANFSRQPTTQIIVERMMEQAKIERAEKRRKSTAIAIVSIDCFRFEIVR